MGLACLHSFAIVGIDAYPIQVEVDISFHAFYFSIVGLPDKAISESKDRILSAINNSVTDLPIRKIVVNLAPADIKKQGAAYDLPIALGILAASEKREYEYFKNSIFIGELSLNGDVKKVPGVLSIVMEGKKRGFQNFFVPAENAQEAALVDQINVFSVQNLPELYAFFNKQTTIEPTAQTIIKIKNTKNTIDFSEVKGQQKAKRALEIAAAGGHNVLMNGPPGCGKSMLAKRLPTILPLMSVEEILEITKIYSTIGNLDTNHQYKSERPFRSPHHSISYAGLIGGGSTPKPGEVSLAHLGVLFLDELPEFNRAILELLRQPLEDKKVTISRAKLSVEYPTNFMLIATMNPCPCGYYQSNVKKCVCTVQQIQKYSAKISGPLLDRIDIKIKMKALNYDELSNKTEEEDSKSIQSRINKAIMIQRKRFKQYKYKTNSMMESKEISLFCPITNECNQLLQAALHKKNLSTRSYNKIIKTARTIADLEGAEDIALEHIAEAINYN